MVTAWHVAELLEMHARDVSRTQIRDDLKLGLSTVDDYLRGHNWASGTLPKRLSKLPDYPGEQPRIQRLVHQLGLYGGTLLPPSQTSRKALTAAQLAGTLQMMVDRDKHVPVKGRFLEHVAKTVGAQPGTLRNWITSEGELLRPSDSVRNLPGFDQHADTLAARWSQLGHSDTAAALASDTQATRKEISTEMLVAALDEMVRNPGMPLVQVARTRNAAFRTLRTFISPKGELRIDLEKLAQMPDYDQHVDALRKALVDLGHTEQARNLKPVMMPAATFLDTTREHFGRLMAIVERMALHPGTDRAAECKRSGVPQQLLAVVFDRAGALRAPADVYRRLSGLQPYQHSSVDDMLARIAKRYAEAAAAPADPSLKRIDMTYGGTIPDRVLLVEQTSVDPGPNAAQRLERLYANSTNLVHEPRSYTADRHRQVLRWLSTVLRQRFPESIEVQSYFDAERRRIVVSSNTSEGNKSIRRFLRDGGLERLLNDTPGSSSDMTARELRHLTKLSRRMDPTVPAGSSETEAVFAAIAEGRIKVPKRPYGNIKLHAERRIKDYVAPGGATLELPSLAGTMRPCGTCASQLELPPQDHRGPFWQSRPARYGVDIEDLIAQNQRDGVGTSITKTREGTYTFDVNTDSDSNASP